MDNASWFADDGLNTVLENRQRPTDFGDGAIGRLRVDNDYVAGVSDLNAVILQVQDPSGTGWLSF
jgi:hypothetical protein